MRYTDIQNTHQYFFMFVTNSILFEHSVVFTNFVDFFAFPMYKINETKNSQCNGYLNFFYIFVKRIPYYRFSEIDFIECI